MFNELRYRTFTLIEMLIVIVIIGILAAALVPRLQSIQMRARDTQRKVDLKTIFSANEIYKIDNNTYPDNDTVNRYSYSTQPWISGITGYITSIPVDPKNTSTLPWMTGGYSYRYRFVTASPLTYDLTAQLENTSDPDRSEVRDYLYAYTGVGGGHYNAMVSLYGPAVYQVYEYSPDSNSF